MYNSEFEKKVQEKLDRLGFTPSASVWDAVEAGLPRKEKRRGWWWLGALLLVCFTGAVVLYQRSDHTKKKSPAESTVVTAADTKNATGNKATIHTQPDSIAVAGNATGIAVNKTSARDSKIPTTVTASDILTGTIPMGYSNKRNNVISKRGRSKYSITDPGVAGISSGAPGPVYDTDAATEGTATVEILPALPAMVGALITSPHEKLFISALQKRITEDAILLPVGKPTKQTVEARPWQTSISFSAGASSISDGLFGSQKSLLVYGSSTGSPVAGNTFSLPVRRPSLSFGLGVHFGRMVRSKTRLDIGLRYGFYSGKMDVGKKVDSAIQFNQGGISLNSSAYYRPGGTGSYTNHFHYIELPFTLRFNLTRLQSRYPLFVEGGLTPGFLLQSNTLVQRSNGTFFTDRSAQSVLSLAATTGVGMSFGPLDQPRLLLGVRLSCGLFSSTKQKIDRQNLLSSSLYVQMPLKNITGLVQRRK